MKNNPTQLIGGTPILKLNSLKKEGRADIYVKVEKNNLAGSIKDRIALYMIEEAEKSGKLKKVAQLSSQQVAIQVLLLQLLLQQKAII